MGDVAMARQQFQQEVKELCQRDLMPSEFCNEVVAAQIRMNDAIREHIYEFDGMFR